MSLDPLGINVLLEVKRKSQINGAEEKKHLEK